MHFLRRQPEGVHQAPYETNPKHGFKPGGGSRPLRPAAQTLKHGHQFPAARVQHQETLLGSKQEDSTRKSDGLLGQNGSSNASRPAFTYPLLVPTQGRGETGRGAACRGEDLQASSVHPEDSPGHTADAKAACTSRAETPGISGGQHVPQVRGRPRCDGDGAPGRPRRRVGLAAAAHCRSCPHNPDASVPSPLLSELLLTFPKLVQILFPLASTTSTAV